MWFHTTDNNDSGHLEAPMGGKVRVQNPEDMQPIQLQGLYHGEMESIYRSEDRHRESGPTYPQYHNLQGQGLGPT